ncbi:hypothetical protein JL722_3071 [Aureococcus anophagefferens]|nr:hypothetical protein JL722_3071 [Aureococcus anophagefferens]
MEAREKELAEKHAALLAELRSSLTAAHDAAMAETLGQHEEQRTTQQRRHETELAAKTSALEIEKDREHTAKLAAMLRNATRLTRTSAGPRNLA